MNKILGIKPVLVLVCARATRILALKTNSETDYRAGAVSTTAGQCSYTGDVIQSMSGECGWGSHYSEGGGEGGSPSDSKPERRVQNN